MVCLCLVLVQGASISIIGPCLLDFSVQTNSTLEEVTIIYTAR